MNKRNACIVVLEENCQDGAGNQSRGEDENVNSLAEGYGTLDHIAGITLVLDHWRQTERNVFSYPLT